MQSTIINPWQWQDQFGFVQGLEVRDAQRVLYCAGQASVGADGQPLHADDIRAQTHQSFDNLETVLQGAGLSLANVVRLTIYTSDMDGLLANWDVIVERLARSGAKPASTLLGVTGLAFGLKVEIEATAVA
jgi:enamine deaminase RidA (YjgF/YER057c/UK114 family)